MKDVIFGRKEEKNGRREVRRLISQRSSLIRDNWWIEIVNWGQSSCRISRKLTLDNGDRPSKTSREMGNKIGAVSKRTNECKCRAKRSCSKQNKTIETFAGFED